MQPIGVAYILHLFEHVMSISHNIFFSIVQGLAAATSQMVSRHVALVVPTRGPLFGQTLWMGSSHHGALGNACASNNHIYIYIYTHI